MKKYFLCLLLIPMVGISQQRPDRDAFNLLLGLSANYTITGAAAIQETNYGLTGLATTKIYDNSPTSSYVFPEFHVMGDIPFGNTSLLLRLEATATFIQVNYTLHGNNGTTDYFDAYKVNEFVAGINPQLLYTFAKTADSKFYAGAGVSLLNVAAGNNKTTTSSVQGGPYSVNGTDYDSVSWFSFAASLKAGCFIGDRYDVYVAYTKPFAVSAGLVNLDYGFPSYTANQNIFKIGVNYRLSRR